MDDFSFCQENWDSSYIFGVDSLLACFMKKPVVEDQKSDTDVFCIKWDLQIMWTVWSFIKPKLNFFKQSW